MNDLDQLYTAAFEAYRAGRPDRARVLLSDLLRRAPNNAKAHLLKSVVHDKTEMPVCLALVEQAVALDPTDAQAWYNLGVFESEQGRLVPALSAYRRAVALDPLFNDALGNGCELLRRNEYFDKALEWADRQLALGAQTWAAHLNRAICLMHMRRFDEAEAAFDAARALAPERPIVHWERFALMLFQNRFAEAWDAFEYRFAAGDLNGVFAYPFAQPLWKGEPLAGKHILVHNEQGLGDQIMFASALNDLIAMAGQVTVVVLAELAPLFIAAFPKARVLTARIGAFAGDHPPPDWISSLGVVDYQVPIGSLMVVMRREERSFANPKPFMHPGAKARTRWINFDPGSGLKVGVCWASNPALFRHDSARRGRRKSMTLETLTPLAEVVGVRFVSVLNWSVDKVPSGFKGRFSDVSVRLTSLEETAALIERLDLVITVDTAVAHLAGAMGKETWLLLHDFADCRWELEADKSYWYCNVKMFRQSQAGDWEGVIRKVREALTARVAGGRS